jgi:NAD(P)-dependent dehydrogenase (short-subunit alcohol dehydrogenase family)
MTSSPASPLSSPLSGRIILVTGASRGIGRASALALAKAGAHVIGTARTQGGLEELDDEIRTATGENATLVPLDLFQGDGIDQLGAALFERFKRLDALVHAAATLGLLTPVSHMSPREWDKTVQLNLTASYRLIRSFEPLLRASDAGRAVFLTSSVAARPRAFWGPYAATKAGMEALVRAWGDEVEFTGVRAVLLDPGRMRTKMRAQAFPGEDPASLPDPAEIGPLVVDLCRPDREPPSETVRFVSERLAAEPEAAGGA